MPANKFLLIGTISSGFLAPCLAAAGTLSVNVDGKTITDNGSGDLSNVSGTVAYVDRNGNRIVVSVSNSPGDPVAGGVLTTNITQTSLAADGSTTHVTATDTFSLPSGSGLSLGSNVASAGLSGADTATVTSTANSISTPAQVVNGVVGSSNESVPFSYGGSSYTLSNTIAFSPAVGSTGSVSVTSSVVSSVPEPATLGSIAIGAALFLHRRRRSI